MFFFVKQKTAYEMRISDWSSDVCSSDLRCPCRVSPVTNEKENRMHIKLFRALKAANLSDDAAAEVVEAIEEYIAVKVQEANKGIESKLTAQTWVIGSVGFVLARSEEHTSELQSLMSISYAVFCLKKNKTKEYKAKTKNYI